MYIIASLEEPSKKYCVVEVDCSIILSTLRKCFLNLAFLDWLHFPKVTNMFKKVEQTNIWQTLFQLNLRYKLHWIPKICNELFSRTFQMSAAIQNLTRRQSFLKPISSFRHTITPTVLWSKNWTHYGGHDLWDFTRKTKPSAGCFSCLT